MVDLPLHQQFSKFGCPLTPEAYEALSAYMNAITRDDLGEAALSGWSGVTDPRVAAPETATAAPKVFSLNTADISDELHAALNGA